MNTSGELTFVKKEKICAVIPATLHDGKRRSLLKVVAELLKILMKLADRVALGYFYLFKAITSEAMAMGFIKQI